jgi:single-strand DNA-binding protein
MQQITIIGNLGSDAEFKAENKMLKINVAVSERYMKDGQQVNNTTWYSCAKFQQDATPPKVLDYLKKGAKVLIQGRPSVVEHQGKAYMNIRVERVDIVAFAPKGDGYAPNSAGVTTQQMQQEKQEYQHPHWSKQPASQPTAPAVDPWTGSDELPF